MMRASCAVIFCLAFLSGLPQSEGRVFDFKNENFAMYFGGSFGNSVIGQGAYGLSSGYGVKFDKQVQSNSSAEAGFALTIERLVFRAGVDYVMPRSLQGIVGTSSSGTPLFEMNSSLSAFTVIGNLEYIISQTNQTRIFFGGGYGVSSINLSNEVTMTTAGQTVYGIGSYVEKATGTAPLSQAYFGYETLFTDTATASFYLGYRLLWVKEMKSASDTNAMTGAQNKGQPIVNNDGSARSLDFSGAFLGLLFKFYL